MQSPKGFSNLNLIGREHFSYSCLFGYCFDLFGKTVYQSELLFLMYFEKKCLQINRIYLKYGFHDIRNKLGKQNYILAN